MYPYHTIWVEYAIESKFFELLEASLPFYSPFRFLPCVIRRHVQENASLRIMLQSYFTYRSKPYQLSTVASEHAKLNELDRKVHFQQLIDNAAFNAKYVVDLLLLLSACLFK
jgi:hypothetical protein